VPKVFKDLKVLKVQEDLKEFKDLKVLVLEGHKDPKV
jgi:hypothetical protein